MSIWIMFFRLIGRGFYLLCFGLFCLSLQAGSAFAQSDSDAYIVNDVNIIASGATPNQARINAVANAQKNALIILLGRLNLDPNIANSFDASTISDMVSSQQITNEKIAGNSYSAALNITFSESFVKHYLGDKSLVKNDNKPSKLLVLPIKIIKNQKLIWEETNDWKIAWEADLNKNTASGSIIELPKGDVDDISATNSVVSGDDNIMVNFSDFESMLNKYKADSLVLAYFQFDDIENKVDIYLKIIKKFQSKQVHLSFVNVNQLTPQDLVSKVADKTIEYLNNYTRPKAITNNNSTSAIEINALINNLGDWMTIKNRLENTNLVEKMKINSISKDLVSISIVYNNRNGDIIDFFGKNNLYLQKKNDGQYILTSSSTRNSPF